MNSSISTQIASLLEGVAPALMEGIEAVRESNSLRRSVVEHLENWYALNSGAVEAALEGDQISRELGADQVELFNISDLHRSTDGAKIRLHAWNSIPAGQGTDIHNHLMPVAGIVLRGGIRHYAYPALTFESLIEAWLSRARVIAGQADVRILRPGEAYMLREHDFHVAQNASPTESYTMFLMGAPVYSGNIWLSEAGGVPRVRARSCLVRRLDTIRDRVSGFERNGASLEEVKILLSEISWIASEDPLTFA